jgi:hypothetical protein
MAAYYLYAYTPVWFKRMSYGFLARLKRTTFAAGSPGAVRDRAARATTPEKALMDKGTG